MKVVIIGCPGGVGAETIAALAKLSSALQGISYIGYTPAPVERYLATLEQAERDRATIHKLQELEALAMTYPDAGFSIQAADLIPLDRLEHLKDPLQRIKTVIAQAATDKPQFMGYYGRGRARRYPLPKSTPRSK